MNKHTEFVSSLSISCINIGKSELDVATLFLCKFIDASVTLIEKNI